MAISAYEPRPEELPEDLCEGRITFLKITCTITGYQPSEEETRQIVAFPDVEGQEDTRDAIDRILDEYFACYGVLLNVAVFPLSKTKKELRRTSIDFSRIDNTQPGAVLPNPFERGGVKFEAVDQPNNRLVDLFPAGGDGAGELDLHKKMVVTFPPDVQVEKVEAKVVHVNPAAVTMEAFRGSDSMGLKTAGPEQGEIHEIVIEGQGIDRVVFTTPENDASLLEFAYSVAEEVTVDPEDIDLQDYPHIIDFEPKTRDLYQAATETGEILTGSKSGVKTDKSFTHTESTESSSSFGVEIALGGKEVGGKIFGSTSRKNTDTDQDHWAVETDASRERRETQSTTTQLSQMYNLLNGYHVGTNRAVFLMLARPHVLQPTDFRTFVQGLRAIEGVQEFFLIVARHEDIEGLCVEVFLETGHFSENAPIIEPEAQYYERFEDFAVRKSTTGGFRFGGFLEDRQDFKETFTIDEGWVIDRRPNRQDGLQGNPEHPGVILIADENNDRANDSLESYKVQIIPSATVEVSGSITGRLGEEASFDRTYRVLTRSQQPKQIHEQPRADTDHLLITNRGLCVCFKSGEDCPEVLPPPEPPIVPSIPPDKVIVDEPMIKINPALLTREASAQTRTPAMKAFLNQVERSLTNSWRFPRRYPLGQVGFLESEYFKNRIKKVLPNDHLERHLIQVNGLPQAVIESLGERCTVAEALEMDLTSFAKRTGLNIEEAGVARRRLLGIAPRPGEDEGTGTGQRD